MLVDLTEGEVPASILRLFHARGVSLGARNPSINVLLPAGLTSYDAAQVVYRRLRMTRGLNSSVSPYPLCHDGEDC